MTLWVRSTIAYPEHKGTYKHINEDHVPKSSNDVGFHPLLWPYGGTA